MQNIGLALLAAAAIIAFVLLFRRQLAEQLRKWRNGARPTPPPPPAPAPNIGDDRPVQADAETAERIADMRWRAAGQILFRLGAMKAPGLLREFVEDANDPVRSAEAVMEFLGCEPRRVGAPPPAGGFNPDREEFVSRLDAFCVLEEEISGPEIVQAYRDSVLMRLRSGGAAYAYDLGTAFSALREAQNNVRGAHEYEAPDFEIPSLADFQHRLEAFAEKLHTAPPPDALRARLDAETFKAPSSSFFTLARETNEWLSQWEQIRDDIDASDAGDAWCRAKRNDCDSLLNDLDAHAHVIYRTDADLPTMLASLNGVRQAIEALARLRDEFVAHFSSSGAGGGSSQGGAHGGGKSRYGGGGAAGPTDEFSEPNVWRFFGYNIIHAGRAPPFQDCRSRYRKMRGEHHPDQFMSDPAKYKEAEEMSKYIGQMWDQAKVYFGSAADMRG